MKENEIVINKNGFEKLYKVAQKLIELERTGAKVVSIETIADDLIDGLMACCSSK